jgi:Glycosyltransferase family 87
MSVLRTAAIGWIVLLAACSLPNVGLWNPNGKADTGLYSLYGGRIVHGQLPYRSGFSMEFPPGAIPALAVPALPRSNYVPWFKAFEVLCAAAAIGAVAFALAGAPARRRYGAVIVAGAAPAALGPIALNSFDFWPSALAAWAVALTVRSRPRSGLAFLGAATAAKLYPALLAPALLAYIARERGTHEARRALLAAVAVVAAVFVPFAALAPGGLKATLQEQATRGLQIESLGGSLLGVGHRLGAGFHVVVSHAPFSFDIGGSTADALGVVLSLVVLAATAAAWLLLVREGPVDRGRTLRAVAATAVGFVAFAKVLSPQYLLFLVPLVPLVDSLAAWAGLLLVLGLTQIWARFPEPFLQITHLGGLIWVVLVRNLALVALYVLLVLGLRRTRATSST